GDLRGGAGLPGRFGRRSTSSRASAVARASRIQRRCSPYPRVSRHPSTDAWQRVRAALVLVRSAFVVAAVVPVVIAFHGFERGDELALLFVAEAGVGVQQGVLAR